MAEALRLGVVLSSGGGRGVYAHTGFMLALEQLGVTITAASGCSAGAIVGGVLASGTPLQQWAQSLAVVKRQEFWTPDSLPRFLWQMAVHRGQGYTGLSRTDAAIAFCRRNLSVSTFEECRYPFYTVAVSLGRGRKVVFESGNLAPRMMASAAMPILYRPVELDGDLYCDGALIELAPMEAICCKHRLDAVIIHHTSQSFDENDHLMRALRRPWSMFEILNRILYHRRPWYLSDKRLTFRWCPGGCGAAVIVVEPELPELGWPLTEGGLRIEHAAMEQTEALLRPYLDAMTTDPRNRLPMPPTDKHLGVGPGATTCGSD